MIACRQGQRTASNHVSRGEGSVEHDNHVSRGGGFGENDPAFDDHRLSLQKGPDARARVL